MNRSDVAAPSFIAPPATLRTMNLELSEPFRSRGTAPAAFKNIPYA